MSFREYKNIRPGLDIAVIGLAGRFPGARNCREFWDNLQEGVESISFFSDHQLIAAGVSIEELETPGYVKAKGVLAEIEYFDAYFFGYSPGEAEKMDPQIRVLHECAWHALEDAGYDPYNYEGAIGFYVGAQNNFYWQARVLSAAAGGTAERFGSLNLADKDQISTRISYKFNLKGPSFTLVTQCSTSLVAVHQACQGLLAGECDMALAGGISITMPQKKGYLHQEGMILSPDGHLRAFDSRAQGTVFGSGVGIVVLKPITEAVADGDNIMAVIKSSFINNDGNRKVGYTAPSIEGQAEVIRSAIKLAEVEPESISYIETHGTATPLGDYIEIEALKLALNTDKKLFCMIGTAKTNVGHLENAAGAAGLIKTILALKHKLIPPTLHFENPNPKIDFKNSPFYVNTELTDWKIHQHPLRAGVSSFGIGGTNAHVILEEWPFVQSVERKAHSQKRLEHGTGSQGRGGVSPPYHARDFQLLVLSAKTPAALDKMTVNLVEYLKQGPAVNLADAAYTLQAGRRAFPYRRTAVGANAEEIIAALKNAQENGKRKAIPPVTNRKPLVVFMFPGQGSQYVNMGRELYQSQTVFRREMDRCFEILKPLIGYDIKEILYPGDLICSPLERGVPGGRGVSKPAAGSRGLTHPSPDINQTEIAQPLLFAFEYALARLLITWGIIPGAMIGHSIGEYTAACLSGVLTLEDALKLVAARGILMQKVPPGAMLSVPLGEEEIIPLLDHNVSLAAVNASSRCVVSGPHEAVEAFEKQLKQKGCNCRWLHTSHAFHSSMMDPILREFAEPVAAVRLNPFEIPYISNLTGDWIRKREVLSPKYWSDHLRQTVRFARGIEKLLQVESEPVVFIEVGPGNGLSTLVRQELEGESEKQVISLVPPPDKKASGHNYLLNHIGQLWLYGVEIDWTQFDTREEKHRISLPPYPFEGKRYWIDSQPMKEIGKSKPKDISDWFYMPSWKRSRLPDHNREKITAGSFFLVFVDNTGLGIELIKRLQIEKLRIIAVRVGNRFKKENPAACAGSYTINPGKKSDYERLFNELTWSKVNRIIHLWNVTDYDYKGKDNGPGWHWQHIKNLRDLGFYSLLYMVQTMAQLNIKERISIKVVSNYLQDVTGEEFLEPGKALLMGMVQTIPLEYPNIHCQSIDLTSPGFSPGQVRGECIDHLYREILGESPEKVVAYRGRHRWVQFLEPMPLKKSSKLAPCLREKGIYLITGGLGGMGLAFAQYLANTVQAKLILMGRTPFPARERWDDWLENHGENDAVSVKIKKIKELEKSGGEVLIASADVANPGMVKDVAALARETFGEINGIIHAAGIVDDAGVILNRPREMTENILAPKVNGTLILDDVTRDIKLDFFLLCSSLSPLTGAFGQVGYCAANSFLDAFAYYKKHKNAPGNDTLTLSINWDSWKEVGMAVNALKKIEKRSHIPLANTMLKDGILTSEGIEALERILRAGVPQAVVSTKYPLSISHDLDPQALSLNCGSPADPGPGSYSSLNDLERKLIDTWEKHLAVKPIGIDDDFYRLGGDSLKAMILIGYIHKVFAVKISIPDFLNHSTIRSIAQLIVDTRKEFYREIKSAEKKEYYVLSSAQKRLYILQQTVPASTGYNQPLFFMLEGNLDRKRMHRAVKKIVDRHESLRTSFAYIGDMPVQKIHHRVEFEAGYGEINGRELCAITDEFIQPFDLSSAPLFRVRLIKVGKHKHILMMDMHHIITDEASSDIFINDFVRLYRGEKLGPLPIQYKDFSEWHNQLQVSDRLTKQEHYWLRQFKDGVPRLEIPVDFPPPSALNFKGAVIDFELGEEISRRLHVLTEETGSTLYMILLAVYNVLLSKYTGQEDIVVGSPISGRPHLDLENVVGMFVNMLVMRNRLDKNQSFKEYLQRVKENAVNAYENQDYQFPDLVNKLNLPRTFGRNPIFNTVFQLSNTTIEQIEIDHLKVISYENPYISSQFDLIFTVFDVNGVIKLNLTYSTELYKPSTAEKIVRRYIEILKQVIDNIDCKLKEITLSYDILYSTSSTLREVGEFGF